MNVTRQLTKCICRFWPKLSLWLPSLAKNPQLWLDSWQNPKIFTKFISVTRQLTKSIGFSPKLSLWLPSLAKNRRLWLDSGEICIDFRQNYLYDFHRRGRLARALDVPGVRGGGVLPVLLLPGRAGRGGGGRLHRTRPHLRGQGRHLPQVPLPPHTVSGCFVYTVVDPDPHSFGCPGSILGIRIRIQELGNWSQITKIPGFSAFQKGHCTFVGMFFLLVTYLKYIFVSMSFKGLSHEIDFKNFDKNLQNLT